MLPLGERDASVVRTRQKSSAIIAGLGEICGLVENLCVDRFVETDQQSISDAQGRSPKVARGTEQGTYGFVGQSITAGECLQLPALGDVGRTGGLE